MIAVFFCAVFSGSHPTQAQVRTIDGRYISLAGVHDFRDAETAPWRKTSLPGLWRDMPGGTAQEQGWYRISFRPTAGVPAEPVFTAYLLGQDEVWLNGRRIGGYGDFTLPGAGQRPISSYGYLRIYPIPPGVLLPDQENTLLIRLNRQMLLENGGVADFLFGIAERPQAELARSQAARTIWAVDGAFLAFNALLLFIAITARLMGITHPVTRTAIAVTFAMTVVSLLGGHFPGGTLATDAWMTSAALIAGLAVIAFYMEYVAASLDIEVGRICRVLQILLLFGIIPSGILPFSVPDAIRLPATIATLAGLTGALIWLTGIGLISARHGDRLGWLFFLVFLVLIDLPLIWGIIAPEQAILVSTLTGRTPLGIGGQILTVILSGIFAHRTFRFERESLRANERALKAQEQERLRVARDMHDSVGQWLGSIKMRLQALPGEHAPLQQERAEEFSELLGDMDVLIDDTRRIAHDLSAISVARSGLKSAIKQHLMMITDDHGIQTVLNVPENLQLPVRTADHLYRIVQEATANAVKHGNADMIRIGIEYQDGRLVMTIHDDGIGFDSMSENKGLGLASIRDRAAMLQGLARITSARSGGAEIRISIPAPATQ